ncbi:DUF262 domain-containing protein [Woeseia oceani]|uniref:GmrSD restriction endonucleases N-terminal domain-containing protein n=1 Tax=Woeseia oceani TaxID=1548547 RepID=A0A193LE70_9GAMM|nr:DUF262 domain-containing protein [Woeseia oceani]ANO50825.1 hypothetical protein BA177_06050 [Woeseia oceani]
MNDQLIDLRAVDELRVDDSGEARRFFIPDYQRGFRWSPLQVRQLLDDIREFTQRRNPQPEEFYCLQPLVIKARSDEGDFEVVDGQQRLTTLLLIMRHFNERLAERYRQPLFRLDYKTRPSLDAFLDEPSEEAANVNVDFYHLYHAIDTIEDWFEERDSEVEKIKDALLNQTKVIWFQLADSDNPVEAFTRLNVGKIPLTNDELIRALFLRRSGPDDKDATSLQLRIAYEWDHLEKTLQSDAFWYFLSNQPGKSENRIGFLFDLVARADGLLPGAEGDAYGIFYTFNEKLNTPGTTAEDKRREDEWRKIKQLYLLLEEWFEDRVLYHMVGFLVSQGMSIIDIQSLSVDCTKSAFVQHLREEIFERAIGEEMPDPPGREAIRECVANRLEELTYLSHRDKIRALLLLFNLATLLQNRRSNLRFQFDSFKSERWDIEHIRSVTDDRPERHHDRRRWLENSLGYLESKDAEEELREDIRGFLNLSQVEATNQVFDPLYERVLEFFGETNGGEAEHGIPNLTLLDESTNRSYKNAVFAVKRQRLLDLDQSGIFVPLCTRNVFLKCYNPQVDNVMFWGEDDRNGYLSAIADVLADFFCGIMEGAQ